jgi:hypothetical protein
MDINKMTGEEIAEALIAQFTQLIQAQNNIRVLQDELAKRKAKITQTEPVQTQG